MTATDSQWPDSSDRGAPSDRGDGLDSAVLRATVGARLFDVAPYRIGRFTIVRRLGAGGMGVVYLGYDPELEREVAIKVLRADPSRDPLQSERDRAGVRSEAQAMAKLRHPHVVVVHEVGEHDGGLFVAMEYVRGSTLRSWITGEPRSVGEIIAAYVAAGRGLAAAHEVGLVHRDFKPDNVLVGDDGRVLVTDFGLARVDPTADSSNVTSTIDDDEDAEVSRRSLSGTAGTPAYMAPECLRREPANAASDQFSFCIALYEALWGSRPFGESKASLSVLAHGTELPRPPATRRVASHVRAAVLRGLSRDPGARFTSMNELLRVLAHDRNAVTRRWGIPIALAGLSAGALWWQSRVAAPCTDLDAPLRESWNDARKVALEHAFAASDRPYAAQAWAAVAERTDAWTAAWSAEAVSACRATEVQRTQSTERLDRRVACLDQRRRALVALLDVLEHPDAATIERAPQAVERLPRPETCGDLEALDRRAPIPTEPDARAAYDALVDRIATARAVYDTGNYARARDLATPAVAAAVALGHRPTEADARLVLGDALDELGNTDEARRELERTIAAAEAGGADEVSARAWIDLAYVEGWSSGNADAAERALGLADAEIEALGNPHDLHGTATKLRAAILAVRGRFEEAEPLARAAVDELVLANAGGVRIGGARLSVGTLLYDAGRWDEALAWTRDAEREFTEAVGPLHPNTLSARSNAANVLNHMRRLDEALAEHLEVLALREESLGVDHPTIGANLNAIASAYYYRGEFARAIEFQRRALALAERTRGLDHPDTLVIRENLASFLPEAGLPEEALTLALEVLAARRRVQGPEHPDVVAALEAVGASLSRLGRKDEAATRYAEAIALGERALGPDHPLLLDTFRGGSRLALGRGDAAEAQRLATRGLAIGEKNYTADHIKLASVIDALADAEQALGRDDVAAALRARAQRIAAKTED